MDSRIGVGAAIAMAFAASSVHADDYYWNSATGGVFQEPSNWLGPVPPPGAGDSAIFDLDATYQVDFSAFAQNAAAIVEAGNLTFDLGWDEYQVGNLVVADYTYQCMPALCFPVVTIAYGTLEASYAETNNSLIRVSTGGRLLSRHLTVSFLGDGQLEVLDGGIVVNDAATIGEIDYEDGYALIDGSGSQWTVFGLTVGSDGGAHLTVRNGGLLATGSSALAAAWRSTYPADAVVTGAQSTWVNSFDLVVGGLLDAMLSIADGGLVTTQNAFVGQAFRDDVRYGRGTVEVTGTGSLLRVFEALVLGGDLGEDFIFDGAAGGRGTLRVTNGGQVAVGEQLLLWNEGTVELQGGGLDLGTLAITALPGELHVHSGATLGGSGTVQGLVTLGGTIDPGGADGETGVNPLLEGLGYVLADRLFRIEGDLAAEDTATLTFDIAGPAASGSGEGYDAVEVTGTAQLGGDLVVNVLPQIANDLAPGDVFTVLNASGLSGAFANVQSGGWLPETSGLGSFQVFYGPGSPFGADLVTLVPEPAHGVLVLTGALVLAAARRKPRV